MSISDHICQLEIVETHWKNERQMLDVLLTIRLYDITKLTMK